MRTLTGLPLALLIVAAGPSMPVGAQENSPDAWADCSDGRKLSFWGPSIKDRMATWRIASSDNIGKIHKNFFWADSGSIGACEVIKVAHSTYQGGIFGCAKKPNDPLFPPAVKKWGGKIDIEGECQAETYNSREDLLHRRLTPECLAIKKQHKYVHWRENNGGPRIDVNKEHLKLIRAATEHDCGRLDGKWQLKGYTDLDDTF